MRSINQIIKVILALLFICSISTAKIIYVDDDATGVNDGSSWVNAYVFLQDALADANDSEKPVEIRVAGGAYRPDMGANQTVGDRMATFQLINGVTIAGGYAGATDPNARDIELYESFLYGDLNGNDAAVDDPCDLFYEASRFENSYNIVVAENIDETAVLDGFTITAGFAVHTVENTYRYCMGAGLFCYEACPVIANCTFILNVARDGGGMCNYAGDPNLINCRFISNAALTDVFEINRGAGGGLCNYSGKPAITGCEFIGNYAIWGAGIVDFADSDMIVTNCTFIWNSASSNGGGMWSQSSNLILTNCRFTENQASSYGGAIYSFTGESQLVDCIFENNHAGSGGGCMINSIYTSVINCIFIGNNAAYGGGFYNDQTVYPDTNDVRLFDSCILIYNHAQYNGGGIYNHYNKDVHFNNCYFIGNSSEYSVGGIYNINSIVTMNHCTFTGNSALIAGGAIGLGESTGKIRNCTIAHNRAPQGESLFVIDAGVDVSNSILWGSTEQIFNDNPSEIVINYSTVKGGWEGQGNIIVDPLFAQRGYWVNINDPNIVVEPGNPNAIWLDGDYHLKSQAGRWDPTSQSWVVDDVTSPCIDRGDPNSPVGGELFPNGGRINMGAYGGTREASMSLETGGLSLPDVAFIYLDKNEQAESFQSLLESYGCPTTLIKTKDVTATSMDSFDLIIVANDTFYIHAWTDFNGINAIEDSGKPIVGLGYGGFDFFGKFGLSIGSPHGARNSYNNISVIDPNDSLFSTPYPIDIPQDGTLQLYTETDDVAIYLWPDIPETVVVFAVEPGNPGYYPLLMEHNRYLLWGFTESPEKMTETGKRLFVNTVIWTANAGWENEN